MRAPDPEAALRDLIAAVEADRMAGDTMTNTNDDKIVGRFCETPWRLTQTPYNVEPTLMKGRGGTPRAACLSGI